MQNIRPVTGFWNSYPYTFIKQSAIGGIAGCLNHLSTRNLVPICSSSTSKFSNYLCLKSESFFAPQNLSRFVGPIREITGWMGRIIQPIIPSISLNATNCSMLGEQLLNKVTDIADHIEHFLISDVIKKNCCNVNFNQIIAAVFAEELIYRVGIQQIALLTLARLCPVRLGKFIAHPISRIIIASSIFAFSHLPKVGNDSVLSHFIMGLICGSLYEKYGFLAATTSHIAHNLLARHETNSYCNSRIPSFVDEIAISAEKSLQADIDLFLKTVQRKLRSE